ncbi:MAG: hypothetical protein KatS3mg004_2552 [Bryobacteraceae bacterium]|nr:MAG: hypothetical protein KatS3mg004_2552 [Bryobacteraceae bacterium]
MRPCGWAPHGLLSEGLARSWASSRGCNQVDDDLCLIPLLHFRPDSRQQENAGWTHFNVHQHSNLTRVSDLVFPPLPLDRCLGPCTKAARGRRHCLRICQRAAPDAPLRCSPIWICGDEPSLKIVLCRAASEAARNAARTSGRRRGLKACRNGVCFFRPPRRAGSSRGSEAPLGRGPVPPAAPTRPSDRGALVTRTPGTPGITPSLPRRAFRWAALRAGSSPNAAASRLPARRKGSNPRGPASRRGRAGNCRCP